MGGVCEVVLVKYGKGSECGLGCGDCKVWKLDWVGCGVWCFELLKVEWVACEVWCF